ncbi:hypothetical protein [Lacrimispora sp.]|uniref:hypothetical protein n=1 Tax=Lacrimispora sp. TaxID=2719234 RepID=UPI0032E480A8
MSIKVLAICGAAQKNRNTATMLKSAFDGAMSVPGATGEMVGCMTLISRAVLAATPVSCLTRASLPIAPSGMI